MKNKIGRKFPTLLVLLVSACVAKAQWNTSGTNISNANVGNVGVSVDPALFKLDVHSGPEVTTARFSHTAVNGGLSIHNKAAAATGRDAQIRLTVGTTYFGGSDLSYQLANKATSSSTADFFIQYWNGIGYAERMRINSNGNVGIGTVNPTQKLDVAGSAVFGSNTVRPTIIGGNAGTNYMQGDHGGWSFGWHAKGFAGTDRGGFGWYGGDDSLYHYYIGKAYDNAAIYVYPSGNVGIGTSDPKAKLAVNGDIFSKKVKVTQTGWADYVFEPSYKLPTLQEVAQFIKQQKHLPDVPSAKEVEENGLDIGENQAVLLKKIEELTLYAIDADKRLKEQEAMIAELQGMMKELRTLKQGK